MPAATAQGSVELVLRPRFSRTRLVRWYPPSAVVILAAMAAASGVATGWTPLTLAFTGGFVMLLGGAIEFGVITRDLVTVRGGAITVRRPLRHDIQRPISTVMRVSLLPGRPATGRRGAGGWYALILDDGSTLTVLLKRRYRSDDLSTFLALLPAPEPVEDTLERRDIFRSFRASARSSGQDLVLVGLSYVLVFGGGGMALAGLLAMHR